MKSRTSEFNNWRIHAIIPAVIGAVGGLIGAGIASSSASKQTKTQDKWAGKYFDREQQWRDEDIERASIGYRMKEYQDAGLHPTLATGMAGGGAFQGSGKTQSGGRVPTPVQDRSGEMITNASMAAAAEIMDMKVKEAQSRLLNADADEKEKETKAYDEIHPELKMPVRTILALNEAGYSEKELKEISTVVELMERDKDIIMEGGKMFLSTDQTMDDFMASYARQSEAALGIQKGWNEIKEIAKILLPGAGTAAIYGNRQQTQRGSPKGSRR